MRVGKPFPLSRDALMQRLLDRGISTRRGIMNAHQEPAYCEMVSCRLPRSEWARDSIILLPLYSSMTEAEQSRVIDEIAAAVAL